MLETTQRSSSYEEHINLFTLLWAITTLFHQITFNYWIHSFFGISTTIFCVLIILFRKHTFFLCALLSNVFFLFNRFDSFVANHIFFEWLVNTFILLTIVYHVLIHGRSIKYHLDDIWRTIYPFIRIALVILYFFVVFHKLNYDFFDTYLSCGGVFFSNLLEQYHLINLGFVKEFNESNLYFLRAFSIYFTIISEVLIPILLITKKYRNYGILYGICFHIILAFYLHNGVFSFSGLMLCYYMTFFDKKSVVLFNSLYNMKSIFSILLPSFLFICIYYSLGYFSFQHINFIALGLSFFLGYSVFYLFNFLKHFRRFKNYNQSDSNISNRFSFVSYFMLFIIFINGSSPYLGLKTQASFAMFSNLKTENNNSNHFIIPQGFQLFSYQLQIVSILSTNIEELKPFENNNKLLVLFEVIKIINKQNKDFNLEFKYKSDVIKISKIKGNIENTSNLDLNQSYLALKYFKFRPVYTNQNFCQH